MDPYPMTDPAGNCMYVYVTDMKTVKQINHSCRGNTIVPAGCVMGNGIPIGIQLADLHTDPGRQWIDEPWNWKDGNSGKTFD